MGLFCWWVFKGVPIFDPLEGMLYQSQHSFMVVNSLSICTVNVVVNNTNPIHVPVIYSSSFFNWGPGARTPAWCPPLQTLFQYCTVLFCISLFFYCSNPIFSALHPDRITLFPNVKPPGNAGARRWEIWSFYLCFSLGVCLFCLGWGCSYGLGEVVERATAK